jgi:hypothetical protein
LPPTTRIANDAVHSKSRLKPQIVIDYINRGERSVTCSPAALIEHFGLINVVA